MFVITKPKINRTRRQGAICTQPPARPSPPRSSVAVPDAAAGQAAAEPQAEGTAEVPGQVAPLPLRSLTALRNLLIMTHVVARPIDPTGPIAIALLLLTARWQGAPPHFFPAITALTVWCPSRTTCAPALPHPHPCAESLGLDGMVLVNRRGTFKHGLKFDRHVGHSKLGHLREGPKMEKGFI